MSFHSGFVCILGRPNAGKSTLLNALVGEKLAIISPKPQTTRNRILGIINVPKQKGRKAGQIVLIDTPGVHQSGSSLEVREALEGCELILLIADAKKKWDREDAFVLDLAKKAGTPVFLLLNKIDLLADKSKLLPLIAQFQSLHDFKEIVPISALKKKGLDELLSCVLKALPKGPRYFPEDQITDQPVRFMAAELIREHVLMQTHEEVPHAVSVLIEQFEEGSRLTRIGRRRSCSAKAAKCSRRLERQLASTSRRWSGLGFFLSFSLRSRRAGAIPEILLKNSTGGVNCNRWVGQLTKRSDAVRIRIWSA